LCIFVHFNVARLSHQFRPTFSRMFYLSPRKCLFSSPKHNEVFKQCAMPSIDRPSSEYFTDYYVIFAKLVTSKNACCNLCCTIRPLRYCKQMTRSSLATVVCEACSDAAANRSRNITHRDWSKALSQVGDRVHFISKNAFWAKLASL